MNFSIEVIIDYSNCEIMIVCEIQDSIDLKLRANVDRVIVKIFVNFLLSNR